jgi:hypothetical protein
VADTRNAAGPLGGPALASGSVRVFPVTSASCAIPATAKALSLNVTVVGATGGGSVSLRPGDQAAVATSTINFSAGQVRANNAVLALSRDGQATLAALASLAGGGQVHLIVDVNGYFQ